MLFVNKRDPTMIISKANWRSALGAFVVLLGLSAPFSVSIGGPATTFSFSGTCTDCTGLVTGELTLRNFQAGQPFQLANFVSFDYRGSNLLAPFSVSASDLEFFDGALNADGSLASSVINFGSFQTSAGDNDDFFLRNNGFWVIGSADFGTAGRFTPTVPAAVPAPATLALLPLGLAWLHLRRRQSAAQART